MCIFAKQLQYVLKQHGKDFGQLYNIRVEAGGYDGRRVAPEKIKRLRMAVTGTCKFSTTLNAEELETVQNVFSFDQEEIERLRAALSAEAIQHFLLSRIKQTEAQMVGEALFKLLFDADGSAFSSLRNSMINSIRNDVNLDAKELISEEQNTSEELEAVIETYESALIWLDTAHLTQNLVLRQGYHTLVISLLTSALAMIDTISTSQSGTLQLPEWRQEIQQALIQAETIMAKPLT